MKWIMFLIILGVVKKVFSSIKRRIAISRNKKRIERNRRYFESMHVSKDYLD